MDALRQAHQKRVEGVVTFVDELARAVRREFDPHWLAMEEDVAAAAAAGDPAQAAPLGEAAQRLARLLERLVAVEDRVQAGRSLLKQVLTLRTVPALTALNAFDTNGISAAARGLETAARVCRIELARQAAPAPVPASAPVRTTGMLAHLRRLAGDPEILKADEAARTAKLAKTCQLTWSRIDQKRKALEGACTFVADVLAYVEPRLAVLREALRVTALPGKGRPWRDVEDALDDLEDEGTYKPAQLQWLAVAAEQVARDAHALRTVHAAVVRWEEARRLAAEADLLLMALGSAPSDRLERLLDAFDLAKLRAAIYPLSHLHVAFRDVQGLDEMFPPPVEEAAAGG